MELIGLLMREHRLIEKIVSPLETELHYISHQKKVHPQFIYAVIDFFRTYADEYHHGKEEDILFLEMKKKELVPELQQILWELEEEHCFARRTVGDLEKATGRWRMGDDSALTIIANDFRTLIQLYPRHIEKEDKHFFFPIQDYFTKEERKDLLRTGYEFDQQFTNSNYKERMKTLLEHKQLVIKNLRKIALNARARKLVYVFIVCFIFGNMSTELKESIENSIHLASMIVDEHFGKITDIRDEHQDREEVEFIKEMKIRTYEILLKELIRNNLNNIQRAQLNIIRKKVDGNLSIFV